MKQWPRPVAALVGGAALILAGCPTPLEWTTPRTIPAGEINHTVGLEIIRLTKLEDRVDTATEDSLLDVDVPPLPFFAYLIRFGVTDEIDIGAKFSTSGAAVADFKFQVVRTDVFDLAIDPGLQLTITTVGYANFPVLAGVNLGEVATFFVAPRISYGFSYAGAGGGLLLYGGSAGFRIGVTDFFAIIPEVNVTRPFDQKAEIFLNQLAFGLGFSFGAQPDYRSEAELAAATPPPPPPAPPGPPIVQ